jgi:hypothetical protein
VTVTIFSLAGCFPLLGHTSGVFALNQNSCFTYFGTDNPNFNRCDDQGYLQLLRTFSLFAIFTLSVQMAQLFLLVTDGEQTVKHVDNDETGGAHSSLMANQYEVPASQQQHQQQQQQQQLSGSAAPVPVAQPYAGPMGVMPEAKAGGYQTL